MAGCHTSDLSIRAHSECPVSALSIVPAPQHERACARTAYEDANNYDNERAALTQIRYKLIQGPCPTTNIPLSLTLNRFRLRYSATRSPESFAKETVFNT